MVDIKLKEENWYGNKRLRLDMSDKELNELSKQQLACLLSIGIKGDDYKKVNLLYANKKATEVKK